MNKVEKSKNLAIPPTRGRLVCCGTMFGTTASNRRYISQSLEKSIIKIRFAFIIAVALIANTAWASQPPEYGNKDRGIRKVTERAILPEHIQPHGKTATEALTHEKVVALEFMNKDGKFGKRIELKNSIPENDPAIEETVEAQVTKDGKHAAVWKSRRNRNEKNPYRIRQSSATEIVWYDSDGEVIGTRQFGGRASHVTQSENGAVGIIHDAGFDSEELTVYHDVPNLKTTTVLKKDPNLVDHFLYVVNPQGKVLLTKRLKGPGGDATNVAVSPSGKWITYSIGSPQGKTTIINLQTGTEESFDGLTGNWEIEDSGELFGWKIDKDEGRYEKIEGRIVWKTGKRIFRKYTRAPGDKEFKPTANIMER